jgi:predicted PurR-regulated permease PerM
MPTMDARPDYKINRYFFLAIILGFAIFLFFSFIQFFPAFLAAITIYVLSSPLIQYLVRKRRWKKSWVAVLIIVLSFFIILLPVSLLITLLYDRVANVVEHPQNIINAVKALDETLHHRFNINIISDKTIDSLQSYASTILSAIVNQGLNVFTTIIMMYFFLYFLIVNTRRMEAAIIFYLPFKMEKINMFGNELVSQTFSNAVGIPLIAFAQGMLGYVAYLIAGVEQPGFWGVITGFASIIPVVGCGIVWVPAGVYLLIIGHTWQGIFVIIWGAAVLGTIDNIIRFVLAKKMADVHPIVTVLGVILGLKLFGITGLIFGPLLISYFFILLQIYYLEYQKPVISKRQRENKPKTLVPTYMQPFIGTKKQTKKEV